MSPSLANKTTSEQEIVYVNPSQECCDDAWEAAFQRFETPAQEIAKFERRLRSFGCHQWQRDASIVEIFCGRGNGLIAWERLGFFQLEGLDLSANLLSQYGGPATCYVADCRELPFDNASRDVVAVQGGLHHLPDFPEDVEQTVAEVRRVLKPGGRFLVVEPWNTLFLRAVHAASAKPWARELWDKLDAFEELYLHEQETYDRWRSRPQEILGILKSHFTVERCRTRWGKLWFLGVRR